MHKDRTRLRAEIGAGKRVQAYRNCNAVSNGRLAYNMQFPISPTERAEMSLANIAFVLALLFTGQTMRPASARVGDFLVTATRVYAPQFPPPQSDRFHKVVVVVKVKNVSARISHTSFTPWLRVKPEEKYLGFNYGRGPNLYQLLPKEESEGGYVFEVRNGTTPVALVLDSGTRKLSIPLAGIRD
jgi:hypothetical protein